MTNDPDLLRARAEEARAIAALLSDPAARQRMLAVAARFEQLAAQRSVPSDSPDRSD